MTNVTTNTPIAGGMQMQAATRAVRRIMNVLHAKRMERETRQRIEGLDAHMLRDIGVEPDQIARRSDFIHAFGPGHGLR